jgi:hypothetical protein
VPESDVVRRTRFAMLTALIAALVWSCLVPVAVADEVGLALQSRSVTGAVLRWGLSNEANNSAFAPGTYNFFSAGKVPDPGRGGSTLNRTDWRQASGGVGVEKWDGRTWRAATWNGLSTTPDGTALGSPTNGRFSNHQLVFSGGVGTVDQAAGTAEIRWTGDATVLLYSGMSFFYLSDPVLEVAGGRGRLTATLSGFASSQTDTTVWEPVAPQQVTLADLPGVRLDAAGFTVQPSYAGVRVTGVPQSTTGASTGSFPQPWVDFMDRLGTAAYWYSSGGATDAFKAALPVTVGLAGSPDAPAPPAQPITVVPDNSAPPAPAPPATAPVANAPLSVGAPPAGVVPPPVAAPVAAGAPVAAVPGEISALETASAPYQLTALEVAPDDPARPWWIVGGSLLGLALLLLVAPRLVGRLWSRRRPAATTSGPHGRESAIPTVS